MEPNELVGLLQTVRDLLIEERWTQGAPARNASGLPVHPSSPEAVAWCIEGAVGACLGPDGHTPLEVLELLDKAALELYKDQLEIRHTNFVTREPQEPLCDYFAHESVSFLNDQLGLAAVHAVLDRAIAIAHLG